LLTAPASANEVLYSQPTFLHSWDSWELAYDARVRYRRPLPPGSTITVKMHRVKRSHVVHNRCWHAENHAGPFTICEE
jgi:hypothetical protein